MKNGHKYVLFMPTEAANRKGVSHQALIIQHWEHDSRSEPVISNTQKFYWKYKDKMT